MWLWWKDNEKGEKQKKQQEDVGRKEENVEIPLTREDFEREFYNTQNSQIAFSLIKALRSLSKEDMQKAGENERTERLLREIKDALIASCFGLIRELSAETSFSYTDQVFKRRERIPSEDEKKELFGFLVYQLSKDVGMLVKGEESKAAPNGEEMRKRCNQQALFIGDAYSSLVTILAMLGMPQPGIELNKELIAILPELESVLPKFADPSKKLVELINKVVQ
ncbi:hypothetical protein JOC94_003040 [Bacillus thermophilus]|uniref:Uncharacterized protein n=2 Tax=Siminovitchia TaxID=2837510 RepID=A0A429X1Y7_SIMTE|nr:MULTISPECIES: hypothetical protein [Siminovitchia]MBM7716029.1 hypothetical protein [Siminovitchia thermophila]RST57393.1 hypothetical protein D5F11_023065 [Siminovitchia terrae]